MKDCASRLSESYFLSKNSNNHLNIFLGIKLRVMLSSVIP